MLLNPIMLFGYSNSEVRSSGDLRSLRQKFQKT